MFRRVETTKQFGIGFVNSWVPLCVWLGLYVLEGSLFDSWSPSKCSFEPNLVPTSSAAHIPRGVEDIWGKLQKFCGRYWSVGWSKTGGQNRSAVTLPRWVSATQVFGAKVSSVRAPRWRGCWIRTGWFFHFGFKLHHLNISELDELRRIMVVVWQKFQLLSLAVPIWFPMPTGSCWWHPMFFCINKNPFLIWVVRVKLMQIIQYIGISYMQ